MIIIMKQIIIHIYAHVSNEILILIRTKKIIITNQEKKKEL